MYSSHPGKIERSLLGCKNALARFVITERLGVRGRAQSSHLIKRDNQRRLCPGLRSPCPIIAPYKGWQPVKAMAWRIRDLILVLRRKRPVLLALLWIPIMELTEPKKTLSLLLISSWLSLWHSSHNFFFFFLHNVKITIAKMAIITVQQLLHNNIDTWLVDSWSPFSFWHLIGSPVDFLVVVFISAPSQKTKQREQRCYSLITGLPQKMWILRIMVNPSGRATLSFSWDCRKYWQNTFGKRDGRDQRASSCYWPPSNTDLGNIWPLRSPSYMYRLYLRKSMNIKTHHCVC